jgi:hypothetical protein
MAKNNVTLTIPEKTSLSVGNVDFRFEVRNEDGSLFGKLCVSKGAIVWYPRMTKRGRKKSWEQFDKFMETSGRRDEIQANSLR